MRDHLSVEPGLEMDDAEMDDEESDSDEVTNRYESDEVSNACHYHNSR